MATFYAKTISNSIDSPAPVWTDSAYTTGATKEVILAAKSDNVTTIMIEGSDSTYTVGSWYDDLGVMQVTKIDGTNNGYFGPASEETVTEPKFVFGSHETGESIADSILKTYSKQAAEQIEPTTGTIFSTLNDATHTDFNIAHNIGDFYGTQVGDVAYVKGEFDLKTRGPGDRNWHPDEIEDSSAEGEGSSSSRS